MRISIIVATDLDGVIGRENRLPWHLPADLAHFKRLTMGKPMIMGRRTFESIGRALPGRTSIVLTRAPGFAAAGCERARSVDEALALAEQAAARHAAGMSPAVAEAASEIMVIGGAQVFRELLPRAGRIYWTEVQAHLGGDTYFPPLDREAWREIELHELPAGPGTPYPLRFRTLERRGPDAGPGRPPRSP